MKRFLVFTDGYHDDVIISDHDEDFLGTNRLVAFLAKPHNEEYKVAEFNMEDADDNPGLPDEVMKFAQDFYCNGGLYRPCTEYEFNSMWYFAHKIEEDENN